MLQCIRECDCFRFPGRVVPHGAVLCPLACSSDSHLIIALVSVRGNRHFPPQTECPQVSVLPVRMAPYKRVTCTKCLPPPTNQCCNWAKRIIVALLCYLHGAILPGGIRSNNALDWNRPPVCPSVRPPLLHSAAHCTSTTTTTTTREDERRRVIRGSQYLHQRPGAR